MTTRWLALVVLSLVAANRPAAAQAQVDPSNPPDAVTVAPSAETAAPSPVVQPATPSAAPPPAAVTSEHVTVPPAPQPAAAARPKVVEWIGRSFAAPDTVLVMDAPAPDASLSSRLRRGAQVEVVGILADEAWLQVRLPDGSLGYVASASIPAVANPNPAPGPAAPTTAVASLPAIKPGLSETPPAPLDLDVPAGPVQGLAVVHDTSTLVIRAESGADGAPGVVPVALVGVDGFGGPPRLGMEKYLESYGNWVQCEPEAAAHYVCKLRDGTDVAKAVLVNGAARVGPGASTDYVAQEQNAKAARRGIWKDGEEAISAIPLGGGTIPGRPGQYVAGVVYAEGGEAPPEFAAAGPVDGLALIEDQPFTLDEGEPAPLIYEPGVGWGFWDRSYKWRRAPEAWTGRLERFHPGGRGLQPVDLERHGFAFREPYFRGPAVRNSFIPGQPPVPIGHTSYVAPAFAPHLSPVLAPGGFGRPEMTGPGFGRVLPVAGRPAAMEAMPRRAAPFEHPGFERPGLEHGGLGHPGLEHGGGRPDTALLAGRSGLARPGGEPAAYAGRPSAPPAAVFAARPVPQNPAMAFAARQVAVMPAGTPVMRPPAGAVVAGRPQPAAVFAMRQPAPPPAVHAAAPAPAPAAPPPAKHH